MGDQYLGVREALDHGNFLMVGTSSDEWGKELQLLESGHGLKHGSTDLRDIESPKHTEVFAVGHRKANRDIFMAASVDTDETNGLSDGNEIPGTIPPRVQALVERFDIEPFPDFSAK